MAATVYVVKTNGVESARMTSKARAIKEAESYVAAAESRNAGDLITVTTEKTNKVVFEYTNDIDFSRTSPVVADESNVTIQGEYIEPTTMIVDGEEIPYDAFLSMAIQERARIDADGGCVGLCGLGTGCEHCDEQYGHLEPHTDAESIAEISVPSHTRYPNGRSGEDDTTALSETFMAGTRVVSKTTGDMGTVVQPYMTGVIEGIGNRMSAVTMTMDDGSKQSALIGALDLVKAHNTNTCDAHECEECANVLYAQCQEAHKGGTECVACNAFERFGFLVMYRGTDAFHTGTRDCAICPTADTRFMSDAEKAKSFACVESAQAQQDAAFVEMANAPESDWMYRANGLDDSDAGFVETMVTKEYLLSVIIDETTGVSIDLGWVTLTMNSAQADDHRLIAALYGAVHGEGYPRGGWETIIRVHDICEL